MIALAIAALLATWSGTGFIVWMLCAAAKRADDAAATDRTAALEQLRAKDHLLAEQLHARDTLMGREREQWARERAQLISRIQDPDIASMIAPTSLVDDDTPRKLHISEDDEIAQARDAVLARLEAAAEAMT